MESKYESIGVRAKACPFCGSKNIKMSHSWFTGADGEQVYPQFGVFCGNLLCQARGGFSATMKEAIETWNQRFDDDDEEDAEERFVRCRHDQD